MTTKASKAAGKATGVAGQAPAHDDPVTQFLGQSDDRETRKKLLNFVGVIVVAAIYIRVSTDQQEEEGTSLDTQLQRCLEYCLQHGYQVDARHIYREVHTGAEYRGRPELTKLRQAARNHEFGVVVIYAFDRLARKQVHQAVIIDDLDQHGVKIECVTEAFDDSAIGNFLRNAHAFAAEIEREKIRERSERGKRERVQKGKLLGIGAPAFGYRWNEDRSAYLVNEEEARTVRRIFSEVANGGTIRGVLAGLQRDRILTRSGRERWSMSTLGGILSNREYIGEATAYRTRRVAKLGYKNFSIHLPEEEWIRLPEGVIPQIIDTATFERVQKVLQVNKQAAARNNPNPEDTLLRSGHVVCGYCGSNMYVRRNLAQNAIDYYCPRGVPGFGDCTYVSIRTYLLDAAAWERVISILEGLSKNLSWVNEKIDELKRKNPEEIELPPVTNRINKINRIQKKLLAVLEADSDDGNEGEREEQIDDDAVQTIRQRLRALAMEKKALELELEAIKSEQVEWRVIADELEAFRRWCIERVSSSREATYEEKRRALAVLGIKVSVWRADHEPRFRIDPTLSDDVLSATR